MWVILKTVDGELARKVRPAVPRRDEVITFKGEVYVVLNVVHDWDSKDDIIAVVEKVAA